MRSPLGVAPGDETAKRTALRHVANLVLPRYWLVVATL